MSVKLKHVVMLLAAWMAATVTTLSVAANDEWQEAEAPPPPVWRKEGLIAIDMPIHTSLHFGVDPTTVTIGPDWVVRYVIVAYNPTGSVNAMYEGLRCDSGEVKTYARANESGQWRKVTAPEWRQLDDSLNATRHTLAFARQGACEGHTTGGRTAEELIRRLKNPRKNP